MSPYGTTLNFICLLTKTRLFNMIDFFFVKKKFRAKIVGTRYVRTVSFDTVFKTGFYLS